MDRMYAVVEIAASLFDAAAGILFVYFLVGNKKYKERILVTILFIAIMYSLQEISNNSVVQTVIIGTIIIVYEMIIGDHVHWFQALLLSAVYNVLLVVSNVMVSNFMAYIMQLPISDVAPLETFRRLAGIIVHKSVLTGCLCLVGVLLRRIKLQQEETAIVLSILVFDAYMTSVLSNLHRMGYMDWMRRIEYLFMVIAILAINVIIFWCIVRISNRSQLEVENKVLQMTVDGQKQSMEKTHQLYEETRLLRHDMKHYLLLARNLLLNEQYEKAEECMEEILHQDSLQTQVFHTSVPVLDAVLNEKEDVCRNRKVAFKVNLGCTEINKHQLDVCVVLGNLLDNAIEAEQGLPEKDRIVELKLFTQHEMIFFMIRNRVKGNILKDNPNLHTTKPQKSEHGWGSKSVLRIINKLEGVIDYAQNGDMFRVAVMMQLR